MQTTKRLYTAKRLYFTCRIKALYMMKEFGVKFEWRQKVKASEYDIFHDWGKTELHRGYTVDDFISDEVEYGSDKIYVATESESIFQKTTNDICQKVGDSCQIILRADKQFFEPEVENENN